MSVRDATPRTSRDGLTIAVSLFACDHGLSGIGRYMVNVVGALVTAGSGHMWHVWGADEDVAVFPFRGSDRPPQVALHPVANRWNRPLASLAWHAACLARAARRCGADVIYLPAGNRRLVPSRAVPTVAVVHDLSSFHVADKYDPLRMLYIRRLLPWLIRRTTRVITISSSSATDIVTLARYPGERLDVIGLGYDSDAFRPLDPERCRVRLEDHFPGFPTRYLLYVSRLEHPGKNHVGLVRAYREVLRVDPGFEPHLVFAGGRWSGSHVVDQEIARAGLGERVHLLGFVPDEWLAPLYCGADALVFPSLYEGFGLPVVEAQACGVPVAAAAVAALAEVVGDAGLLFDPHDPSSMADAIQRIVADDALRGRLRALGLANAGRFRWSETAARSLAILEETAGAS